MVQYKAKYKRNRDKKKTPKKHNIASIFQDACLVVSKTWDGYKQDFKIKHVQLPEVYSERQSVSTREIWRCMIRIDEIFMY